MLYLMMDFRYIKFLRPEFGILLGISHFILLGFILTSMIHENRKNISFASLLSMLILCLPLLCILAIPHARLGSMDFRNRYTGQAKFNSNPSLNFSNPQTNVTESQNQSSKEFVQTSILEIFLDPQQYNGKTVKLEAMLLKDEQMKPYFGIDTAIYRFLITCCAADAMPLAIGLDLQQSLEYAQDQWLQVTGLFEIRTINGIPMPFLANPVLIPIDPPKVPWLL